MVVGECTGLSSGNALESGGLLVAHTDTHKSQIGKPKIFNKSLHLFKTPVVVLDTAS